jgi:hypothetical protein
MWKGVSIAGMGVLRMNEAGSNPRKVFIKYVMEGK